MPLGPPRADVPLAPTDTAPTVENGFPLLIASSESGAMNSLVPLGATSTGRPFIQMRSAGALR